MAPYKIISADSHMCEPPTLWVERIEPRFRDRAPRILKNPDGKKGAFFVCEDMPPLNMSGAFAAGQTFDKTFLEAGLENALPGGWDPAARLKDMELDGVEAEVLYTTCGFMLFGMEDAALQDACFRAYNDWLAEFCRYAPQRFAGLGLVSLFDVEGGVRELERCKKMGLRGAMIWATPPESLPPYSAADYEPFWATAQDLQMPLSLHLHTGGRKAGRQELNNPVRIYVASVTRPAEIQDSLLTLIFSGVLERYSRLQLVSAENDISWIPYLLERADKYHRRWKQAFAAPISLKPSDYFRRQIYFTFIDDTVGLQTYQFANCTDNILWSTDYPHQAATWPHSQEVIARDFDGIPEADKQKFVRNNAAKLYGFPLE